MGTNLTPAALAKRERKKRLAEEGAAFYGHMRTVKKPKVNCLANRRKRKL